jgi:hypothetical protein
VILLHSSFSNYTSALDEKQPNLSETDKKDAFHEGFRVLINAILSEPALAGAKRA